MGRLDLVRWVDLKPNVDARGCLTAIEGAQTIPFEIKRVYFVHDVKEERAGHAHRDTQQLLICIHGTFDVALSDGSETRTYHFDDASKGLYIVPLLFIRLLNMTPDAVLLVLASTHYDKSRSIRSWEEYLGEVGADVGGTGA